MTLAFNKGYNLYECLREHINEKGSISENDAKDALCHLITVLRYNKSDQRDIDLTQLVLEDNLKLKELVELFRVELLLRCSYSTNKDDEQIFSRKFIFQTDKSDDISGSSLFNILTMVGVHKQHTTDTFLILFN